MDEFDADEIGAFSLVTDRKSCLKNQSVSKLREERLPRIDLTADQRIGRHGVYSFGLEIHEFDVEGGDERWQRVGRGKDNPDTVLRREGTQVMELDKLLSQRSTAWAIMQAEWLS